MGRWEGKQITQVEEEEPDAWQTFLSDPATYGFPDGESFNDVYRRVAPAFEQMLEDATGRAVTVAVCHNLVNRVYLAGVMGIPLRMAGRIPQHNASIDLIVRTSGETKLVTVNNLSHLEPILWLPDNFPFPTHGSA